MAESKAHTASGTHDIDPCRDVIFFVSFGGGASGSATLERKIGDGWVPADPAYTASMTQAEITDVPEWFQAKAWRWNVPVSGGTITTYLEAGKFDRNTR